jgi:hypothetical protein
MDSHELRTELERYHRESYGWAISCCSRNPADAENVLQAVYLKVLEGKTPALADQNSLTTAELFDVIAKHLSGRRSEFALPSKFVEWFLSLPFSPAVTGLPAYGVPYFFLPQTYDTQVANKLLKPHDITCPRFDSYCGNLLDFVEEFPKL